MCPRSSTTKTIGQPSGASSIHLPYPRSTAVILVFTILTFFLENCYFPKYFLAKILDAFLASSTDLHAQPITTFLI
jgi:hypothetical protein